MSSWSTKTIGESCASGSRRMREPVMTMSPPEVGSSAVDAGVSAVSGGGKVLCAEAEVAIASAVKAAPARRAIFIRVIETPFCIAAELSRESNNNRRAEGHEEEGCESPGRHNLC